MIHMRVVNHSGRVGSAKHNCRDFDLKKSDHIDPNSEIKNTYWNYYHDKEKSFEEVERDFYSDFFQEFLEKKTESAKKNRHKAPTIDDLLKSTKTKPEEMIFQIGKQGEFRDIDTYMDILSCFLKWHNAEFGSNCILLDVANHFDERSYHSHIRKVWTYTDKDGVLSIGQHKALEELGFELPDKSKPRGQFNNLKIPYTKACREKIIELCRERNLSIESEPLTLSDGSKPEHLKKNDFIIQKQKTEIKELSNQISSAKKETEKLIEENSNLKKENKKLKDLLKELATATYSKVKEIIANHLKEIERDIGERPLH